MDLSSRYFTLYNMLPSEFRRLYPETSKMNPYCVARHYHDSIYYMGHKLEEGKDEKVPTLDDAIYWAAGFEGKTLRSIEKPPCDPLEQMPLKEVSTVRSVMFS